MSESIQRLRELAERWRTEPKPRHAMGHGTVQDTQRTCADELDKLLDELSLISTQDMKGILGKDWTGELDSVEWARAQRR